VLQKAELSPQADSENDLGGSSETYVLHSTRCSQEDDQSGQLEVDDLAFRACALA
jgi:hypothetical protein